MDITIFLAQFLGIFFVIVTLSLLIRRDTILEIIKDVTSHRAALYVLSVVGLVSGLLLVFIHNVWSGGFVTVLVTLIGWIILLKSVLFLVLPPSSSTRLINMFRPKPVYTTWIVIALIIGLYLMYAGFVVA
ncbi:MAG: hypothetical protein P4M11_00310 [Candidatus Pacebacteria bacterium]|nr:hypothetical protein [Candidatus Paceibacterota bacterium]